MVVKKIWDDVEKALDDITSRNSYYVGSTLCIDKVVGHIGVALNLDGKGFVFNAKAKDTQLHLPQHITVKVNDLYTKYKSK